MDNVVAAAESLNVDVKGDKMKKIIFLFFTVLFLAGCVNSPIPPANGNYDSLAQCLTEKGVVMYGTEWCPHCQDQKEMFGSSFQYVDYIDCDENRNACQAAGVRGYPTWVIEGQSHPGTQALATLANLAGC